LLQVVTDLVQGEFMQLGSKETENERFAHYLTKTYRKTASLIANSVKAVRKGCFSHVAKLRCDSATDRRVKNRAYFHEDVTSRNPTKI
jgi:hypothetical protein